MVDYGERVGRMNCLSVNKVLSSSPMDCPLVSDESPLDRDLVQKGLDLGAQVAGGRCDRLGGGEHGLG